MKNQKIRYLKNSLIKNKSIYQKKNSIIKKIEVSDTNHSTSRTKASLQEIIHKQLMMLHQKDILMTSMIQKMMHKIGPKKEPKANMMMKFLTKENMTVSPSKTTSMISRFMSTYDPMIAQMEEKLCRSNLVKTNLERYQMMMMNLRMMLFRENL